MLFSILTLLNVVRLNSRYLSEIYSQGEAGTAMSIGTIDSGGSGGQVIVDDLEFQFDFDANKADFLGEEVPLPPIYWINLDVSTDRKLAMEDMFASYGIKDTHRITATNIDETNHSWSSGDLIFHPNITLEAQDGLPSNKKHIENIYEYQEAACLLSHLRAILKAYEDGHEMVLILEDDALLSKDFLRQWKVYSDKAPFGWRILQFATNNRNVVKQGASLFDYFISWQPYHWSTRAYMIKREGMEVLLNKTHSYFDNKTKSQWIIDEHPVVVADEVLYYVTGETYTSTFLWVDAASFGSTIQSTNAHSNLTSLFSESPSVMNYQKIRILDKRLSSQSILILQSVRLSNEDQLYTELKWILEDNNVVCSIHNPCVWEVNAVLTSIDLLDLFVESTASFPSNIHFHTHILSGAFNKFSYLRALTDEMLDYDHVLFKDNDQRLTGFPWRTFVKRKEDAVVAGPLRQSVDEGLLHQHNAPNRQWFQFHAAEAWTRDWLTKWSPQLYVDVIPTVVPLLEMYFVLMDGKFAHWFFDKILTEHFVNQTSAWGPDLLWCSGARRWAMNRPGCVLVPVVSTHEDTRQIMKNTTKHKDSGKAMVAKFNEDETFKKWMGAAQMWKELIGGNQLLEIEKKCRRLLRLRMYRPFDIQKCTEKMYMLAAKKQALDESKEEAVASGESKDRKQPSKSLLLSPWLKNAEKDDARALFHNRTRVEELVQSVKYARKNHGTTTSQRTNTVQRQRREKLKASDLGRTNRDDFRIRMDELKKLRDNAFPQPSADEFSVHAFPPIP